jgi:hypothetical protein
MTISSITQSVAPNVSGASSSTIGTAVLAKSLDALEQTGEGVIKMMEQSVNPNVGKSFDMKV